MINLYSFKTIGWCLLAAATILIGCSHHTDDVPEDTPSSTISPAVSVTAPGIKIEVSHNK